MRLIDADMADVVIIYDKSNELTQVSAIREYIERQRAFLDKFPTIDAVPAVRCRECKKGEVDDPDFPDQYYCHAGCGWNNGDFYCAYGKRKEGADNG